MTIGTWRRIAFAVTLSAVCGLTQARADESPDASRWKMPDESMRDGQVDAPEPILEVHCAYDADAVPALSLKHVVIKKGHAPQVEPLSAGYILSLTSATGDTLYSLVFHIPSVVHDPPPQPGETADRDTAVLRKVEFALTVPMVEGAAELYITDPQGLVIIHQSLRDAPVETHQPNFRSYQRRGPGRPEPSPKTWIRRLRTRFAGWLDALIEESAEAATAGSVLDVTLVGDNYTAADLTTFHQDIDRVINHFLTYEPYASRASQILFHSVDNTTVDLGCVHSPTMDRLITCNNATVTSVINNAGAPADKIIVLVNDPSYGGSGGAIAVAYNGSYSAQVAVHEFGHTFGELLDEYTLYTTNGALTGTVSANCYAGAPPATAWNGLVASADYTGGCDYPNWYRPSSCSIMYSLSCTYFNTVSQRLLNTKLDLYAGSLTPALTLRADQVLLGAGGSSTLTWAGTNVTGCTASGAWGGSRSTNGTELVSPTATSTYTLACGNGSSTATQSVTVTVDAQPPTVTLIQPADGATVSGQLTLAATASDDTLVARVEFYKDGQLFGADNTSPYSFTWDTTRDSQGVHTIEVQAVDGAGNRAASSVHVTVAQVVDTVLPQVAIGSPASGSRVGNKVNVQASASDNVAVSKLELLIDGTLKATATGGTLSTVWNTNGKSAASGPHSITARAFDTAGNLNSVTITVFK